MTLTIEKPNEVPALSVTSDSQRTRSQKDIRVVLLDMWCFIPYYMAAITRGLLKQNVKAQLLSASYHFDPQYFRENGLTNSGLLDVVSPSRIKRRGLRRWLKFFEYCVNLALFTGKLLVAPPDIIHVQYLALLSHGLPIELWMLAVARKRRVKLVTTIHNVLPHDTGDRHRGLFSRLYKMSDLLICHNRATALQLAKEFDLSAEKIEVIPHGPLQQPKRAVTKQDARRSLGLPLDRTIVLWQGVVSPYKGVEFLLEAWKCVSQNALLLVAGTGEESIVAGVRAKAAELGQPASERLRLDLEFIPTEKVPLYFQAADVLVYPYRAITTSGALMTGIGYGKAIITTRLPAFQEMMRDGEDALMVDYGDAAGLAAAINRLVQDDSLLSELGWRASQLASSKYSWEEIAARTRACYQALLSVHPR